MATRSASLPIEQTYLAKARLAVVAIVLVAAVVVTIAVALGSSTPPVAPDWSPSATTVRSRSTTSRSS